MCEEGVLIYVAMYSTCLMYSRNYPSVKRTKLKCENEETGLVLI